ncbi:MAG: ABC transporter ATP-binding protein [Candidatus Omnitrophica bacterium]|nr:ABC transporter ATP-binding protein [Candidatus Omnitrophota bacterium]
MTEILQINNLHTYFNTDTAVARAVEGASFNISKGETLALVGESGCGKTVTALSIMRLVPAITGEIVQGEIIFQGHNLLNLSEFEMRAMRGQKIGMVFQEPMSSLNPLFTIGYQIQEAILAHQRMSKQQAKSQVIELLNKVEMPEPGQRYSDYPHNLSGGLRQRAMIAQALAAHPELLIADEPTTALDVTIQAQILKLFSRLKQTKEMSILLITHDLGVVAEIADRVCIMYAGRIVEEAGVLPIFNQPRHPYTDGLLKSIAARNYSRQRLMVIPGVVPEPANKPGGCAFHPRCRRADLTCRREMPEHLETESGHKVSCWHPL